MSQGAASSSPGLVDYGTLPITHGQTQSSSSPRKATYLAAAFTSISVALFLLSATRRPMTQNSQLIAHPVQVGRQFVNESGLYTRSVNAPTAKYDCHAPIAVYHQHFSTDDMQACQACHRFPVRPFCSVPPSLTLSAQTCRNLCMRSSSEKCTAIGIEMCQWQIVADLPTACDYMDSFSKTHITPDPDIKVFDTPTVDIPLTLCHACSDFSSPRTISAQCFAIMVFYMARGHPPNAITDGFLRDFPSFWCQRHILNELSDPNLDPLLFGERYAFIGWP